MSSSLPQQGERVQALLNKLDHDKSAMLKLGMSVFGSKGAPMFPLDLMAFGAVKRNISTASAFNALVQAWNMVCARSLLRVHIDTSLRFSAAWLVDNPHDFASRVLKGDRIDKMKDREGHRLTDAHLVDVRKDEYPWLPSVYSNLSGYVHFSGSHIYDSITRITDEDRTIEFEISETDLKFPEFSWIEVLDCFRETTEMLAKFLHGYAVTKRMSPTELKATRGGG